MKSPAFSFYVRDWLCSKTVSKLHSKVSSNGYNRGVSVYMYLLCQSWLEEPPCTLPSDDAELAGLARVPLDEWLEYKPLLMPSFKPLADGRIYNERLMEEWKKQQNRRSSGSKGGSKRQANLVANHQANPVAALEDEIEDEIEDGSAAGNSTKNSNNGRFELVVQLKNEIGDHFKRPREQRWSYEEEHGIVDLCKSPTVIDEWAMIKSHRAMNPGFTAESLIALLKSWNRELDKARNYVPKQSTVNPGVQLKAIDEEIAKHPANRESTSRRMDCTLEQKNDLKQLRAKREALNRQIAHA